MDPLILPLGGKAPKIHSSAFIAPGCKIIGDVEIGEDASIWYNCVIRADVNRILIGARTNIQDGTVVHCDSDTTYRRQLAELFGATGVLLTPCTSCSLFVVVYEAMGRARAERFARRLMERPAWARGAHSAAACGRARRPADSLPGGMRVTAALPLDLRPARQSSEARRPSVTTSISHRPTGAFIDRGARRAIDADGTRA